MPYCFHLSLTARSAGMLGDAWPSVERTFCELVGADPQTGTVPEACYWLLTLTQPYVLCQGKLD